MGKYLAISNFPCPNYIDVTESMVTSKLLWNDWNCSFCACAI